MVIGGKKELFLIAEFQPLKSALHLAATNKSTFSKHFTGRRLIEFNFLF